MKIMKKNRKKILVFIALLLLILLLFLFAISGEKSLFYKVNSTITRIIMLVCFILYVIVFYNLLNICNKNKMINFFITLIMICISMHISYIKINNYEVDLLKRNSKIGCGIIIHKEHDRFGNQVLTGEYSENGILYKYVFGVPSIPAKGIIPRFRGKYNISVGDTVLIRYSVKKPEIRKIYKFKPTSEEIRKYIERGTVIIKDTTMSDTNFEEKPFHSHSLRYIKDKNMK
jgi:hypothetical protein